MFRDWCELLPEFVDLSAVQLPGRENRILEAPFDRMSLLLEELYDILQHYFDMPFMFFGHSLGALISFELARTVRRRGHHNLRHLFISGHPAPQWQSQRRDGTTSTTTNFSIRFEN